MPRARFALPLLFLPLAAPLVLQPAVAQPPTAPSTIKKPAPNPFAAPAPPPDPPQISAAELQTLFGGPTLITLSGQDLPLGAVTRALAEAGGLMAQPLWGNDAERKTSFDWKNMPFWSAAAQVEALTGLKCDSYGEGFSLTGNPQLGLNGQSIASNPYVTLIAQSLTRTSTRTLSFAAKPPARVEPDRVQFQVVAYFDPKLRVQQSTTRALKFQKQGEDTTIPGEDIRSDLSYGGRSRLISPLSFALPPEIIAGTRLSRISGVLHTVIASGSQTLSVPDAVAGAKTTTVIGPHQYTFEGATLEGDQLSVRLSAAFGAEARMDRNLFRANLFNTLRVRDAAGHELSRAGASSSFGGLNASANYRYSLKDPKGDPLPGPYSLEWVITTGFKSLDVPFALRDVVVP